MIERAFIQERGSGRLDPEAVDLRAEFERRGIPVDLFTEKRIRQRRLPLTPRTFVAGDIPVVHGALRQIGVEPPQPNDYPACLAPFLRRRIWPSTVRQIKETLYYDAPNPFFAKPADRLKRFTGRVFESPYDAGSIGNVSHDTPVICSQVVEWVSEYRVYVIRGEVVGIGHYDGDSAVRVDETDVAAAVATFTLSGEAPAGYGIDFGVLRDGRTALVEVNDGFSLGSYGLGPAVYTDLLVARWCEVVG